jgi:DNA mismatch repair protein MutS
MKNFQMEVQEWNEEIILVWRVLDRAADKSYNIHVARLARIPSRVISRAKDLLRELEEEGNVFLKDI